MSDFIQQRSILNKTLSAQESARLDHLGASERLKLLQRKRAALERRKNDNNTGYLAEAKALDAEIVSLEKKVGDAKVHLDDVRKQAGQVIAGFKSLTDPREQLPLHFSNNTPFLLFPTRLETRFKMAGSAGMTKSQLWVRIYPDTCMVDSFDPQLSAQELRNAGRFWAEYYAAGDIVDENNPDPVTLSRQKAAWAFLANLEGAGRAAWITQSAAAKPLPASVFPKRTSDQTIILTIVTEDESILPDQVSVFSFFKSLWLAGKNEQQVNTVKASLANADEVIKNYLPVNFNDPLPLGVKRETADVQVALALMPDALEGTGKTNSWSQAARVTIMPERFVLLGFKGDDVVIEKLGNPVPSILQVGFDPNNTVENNFRPTASGDLDIPEELKWAIDFDEAVEKGMGFRVDLDETTIGGVDRLFVIGLKLGADETTKGGQKILTELFDHHYYSSKGLSIVPQGTPTNNTDKESVPASGVQDNDLTFDRYFRKKTVFTKSDDWQKKQDGQWLSEWLGLDPGYFQKVLNAEGKDQADAINMNKALWPGTLGYAMDAMMKPVFGAATIDRTRQFFSGFVTGRGAVPALRIGNQPYGILPATAFRRQLWMYPQQDTGGNIFPGIAGNKSLPQIEFIRGLYELLLKIEEDWRQTMLPKVAHISAETPGDKHQQLLDIIGLHPTSVEFYKRYMQTLDMLYSYALIIFPFGQVQQGFDKMEFGTAYQLLQDLGYDGGVDAQRGKLPLLSKLYGLDDNWEHKVIIDTVPLSESKELRSYTADDKNYITVLLDNASKSMDALRKNEGLSEQPAALLFAFLKFALEQGYFDTAVHLHERAEIFTPKHLALLREEQPYVHMKLDDRMVESRYALLYRSDDKIAVNKTVGDHISGLLGNLPDLRVISPGLLEQVDGLRHLQSISTARLERAFVEHLDCCSYRLDAWQQGLTRMQMTFIRGNHNNTVEGQQVTKQGIYIGAFGWLENVRPDKKKVLTPMTPEPELKKDFTKNYVTDGANAGFIHAPSVNQAVTAAVLRNAFLSNGKADNNNSFAVNLSSERIRQALTVIEGMQNGQSLAALLGYKFERLLRDREVLVNKGVDRFIHALRKIFPLNANQIKDTKIENDPSVDPESIPITAVEARNVVHGRNLIEHVRKQTGANKNYPFGLAATKLPALDATIATAITETVNNIMNIEDAIADLGLAESVHQTCLGNYDRAAGVLDTYSKGSYPQTPDVIRTPRSGPTLTHRVGLPVDFIPSIPFVAAHPRKSAEPSLDAWLAGMLPPMSNIVCYCRYTDRTDNTQKKEKVTMANLLLEPIDLLYLLNNTGQAALGELDERVLYFVYQNKTPRLDAAVELEYIGSTGVLNEFSVFEVMALVRSLRELILQAAHLKPTDMSLPGEAGANDAVAIELDRLRIDPVIANINTMLGAFTTDVLDVLNALPNTPTAAQKENILQHADQNLEVLAGHLDRLGKFGLPETGVGNLYASRRETMASLYKKVEEIIEHFKKKKIEYETLEAVYDPLAEDAIAQLQNLEATITTKYSDLTVINLPDVQVKKFQFDAKLLALQNLLKPDTATGMFVLLTNIRTQIANLPDYTSTAFDISAIENHIVQFVLGDLRPRAQSVFAAGKKAVKAATDALADFNTLDPLSRSRQVEAAAKAIFGKEFRMLPRFLLNDQQKFELQNTWTSTSLLNYLKNDHKPVFFDPVEDWMHGAARVREKMHHAENLVLLREALMLDETKLSIHPTQLPFKTEDYHWLAMPFPTGFKLEESDVLLYTALTSAAAPSPQYACGFLIDEWTEVIPTENETTGLSFHYDRPSTEAAQAMLLVTPTKLTGNWQWADIVDALHHTLDSARLRAIEPYHIDQTAYARYLPPLVSPVTRHPITIGMYLAELNLGAPVS